MKKITNQLTLLIALFAISVSFGQKAVVIGTNHVTPDGFAFLVTQDLVNGETVYFTEDEYNNATNVFATGESVVRFTASGAVSAGTVIFVNETSTNTFSTSCCGTAAHFGGSFALGTSGEAYYAYQDTDTNPANGVTEIYGVFYTGETGFGAGGTIPVALDPTPDYPNAIVLDGFPTVDPGRAEYQFAAAGIRDGLCRDDLENVSNYLHAQANQPLSTVAFNSFTLACTSPTLTVTRTPASVSENSGANIVYTFTLSAASVGPTTVNFSVGGTASTPGDYGATGAATFTASSGTVVIPNGSTSANVTIVPVFDTTLEPDETVILTATPGTGYTAGSPSSATGTIENDDTLSTTPTVAVTGMNHAGTDGFSFVALVDIAAGTEIFFTEEEFNNTTLAFSTTSGEAVIRWTAPAGGITRGTVVVATETAGNTFTLTCNGGSCGTLAVLAGSFATATNGEGLFAYSDSDTDPTNGVTEVHAVLYTGATGSPGGNIPAGEDPSTVYTGAVVVDGFPAVDPNRTEFRFPPERGVTVDQANFQNTTNWFNAQANATLSDVPFANIIISTGSVNPTLTLAAAPTTTVEDSGVGMVYTFTLSAAAASPITVNFTVGGTATLTTDYTTSGADTFTASAGTATIPMGGTTVAVTVTPVVDAVVEPTETIELMIDTGTGYDGGSPNSATGSITNDDTSASDPLVAIMGMAHDGASDDAFSFAAAQNIPAGTVVYFTEDEFDNTNLLFSSGEAVVQWTAPAGGQIDQGDVIVITETAPNTFTVTCSDTSGNGCGTATIISGSFALATNGETMYAYEDSDTDPTNGVDDIYSVMYTGNSTTPGGNLPAVEDPSGIYLQALVVDGFPAVAPDKTEYTPASRAIPVGMADFENPTNYDHAFAYGTGLSTVPFASLSIVVTFTAPADLCIDAGVQAGLGGGTPTGGVYSGPGVTDDGNGMTYSFDPAAAGVGVHTITYTQGGSSASDDIEVFALPTVAFTAPADLCVDAGVQAGLGGGTPTGGVYSGPGVTDDGNGMTYSFDPAAAGVGTHTITYSFTDVNGCSDSASDDVEVFALPTVTFTAPADLCIAAGVQTGLGGGTPTGGVYSGPGVTDDGNGMTYSFDPAAAGVGVHTLTYTFTDANGCSGSATDDVEVYATPTVSFIAPADLCIDAGAQTGLGGGSPTGGVYSGAGVTDDGNGMTYSFDPAAAGAGTTTITYTFSDANGCSDSASDDVVVFALPTVTFTALADLCLDAGVQAGLGGGTPSGGVYSGPGVTDDGNGMTYSFDPAAAGVGTHTLTYTFTDANGCTNSASDDVEVFALPTVTFTAPPSAICPNTVLTGLGGGTPAGGVYSGPGVTDDGNGMTYTFDSGASGNGTHTITYTFTDANGCTGSASDTVTVEDTTPPSITCPGDITVNNDTGLCSAVVTFTAPIGTDNCSGATTTQTAGLPSGSIFPVGTTTNTFVVTDGSGNTATCSFDVTVIDAEDPTITCPADITVSNDPGLCSALVTYTVSATDNCATSSVLANASPGLVLDIGTLGGAGIRTSLAYNPGADRYYSVFGGTTTNPLDCFNGTTGALISSSVPNFDYRGAWWNPALGQAEGNGFGSGGVVSMTLAGDCPVNGVTNELPANQPSSQSQGDLNTDANEIIYYLNGVITRVDRNTGATLGTAAISGQPGGSNYNANTIGYTGVAGYEYMLYDITTLSAHLFDLSGNYAGSSTIGVTPQLIGYAVTYENGYAWIFAGDQWQSFEIFSSGGGSITVTQTAGLPSGSAFPVGTTTNTFVVTDGAGNTATCSFDITVNDTEPPAITCPADITINNDPGLCSGVVNYTISATDNCGSIATANLSPSKDNSLFAETPGNSNGAGQLMYVGQNGVDESHRGVLAFDVAATIPAGATITGVSLTMTADHPSANNGAQDFNLYRVLEDWGEGASDNGTAPGSGGGGFGVPGIAPDATWDDAMLGTPWAGGPGGTFNPASSAIQTVDANGPYMWSSATLVSDVQDMLDNPGTNFGWIIIGNETTGGGTTKRFGTRESSIPPVLNITYSVDTPLTLVQTAGLPSGSAFPVGTTTNTFVVTDAAGNSDTCSFDVIVIDNEPPVAICQDITVQLDANGMASITAAQIDNGSTDNCGIASLSVSPSTFDCSNVGANTVTLTVTDTSGNSSTCTATVTVEDNVPPVAMCVPDFTLLLDAMGNASLTAMDIDNGSTDACGIASLSISPSTFDCSNVGPNTVTLTVTDVNGNVSTCTTVVTVVDVTPPQIICPMDVNASNDAGICGAAVTFPDALAIDECGIDSVVQTMGLPSGSVFPVGTTTIEFTATDVNGNTNTCSFDIIVTDDEAPVAVCQDITIQLDANGMAMITPMDIDGGSTDNCDIGSLSVSQDTFDCSNVGPNNVILTVTDIYGNSSTCTAVVTVEDVTPPVAVCMDITVELDVNGTVTVDPALVGGASTDACGIGSLALDIDTFTCADVGDNMVTLFVTDVNGNVSTCTAIITVEDNIAPDLVCMDITVELDENGFAAILPEDVIASNTDACGIFTSAVDIFEFDCDDIGAPITVTVFTIDVNGNISSCTAEVTVVDVLAPEVTCPEDQTVDPGAGNLFYEVPDYWASGEATATDNCTDPLTIFSQDPAPGTLLGDGTYTVTLCSTDEYGNEACCTFELTVESILGGADPSNFGTITLYPNPANSEVYLSNPKQMELEQVSIYDMTGRLIKTVNLEGMGAEKAIDISELASATYMFIINNEYGQMTKSIIKE
ncbi:HYR domain-containing protein [Aureitalea sp. L0-47]|uniref:HYR domain-containing protein n=1 Tax=Aureitalea sp. L0-47 TaxID=2816962 RepID=UPI002237B9B7|nr:HYR domain-containing protein [Aureitalea sp. L0-47]MCW5520262.1 HYR domain-containing protein [Aureitalea sp. L0-47]